MDDKKEKLAAEEIQKNERRVYSCTIPAGRGRTDQMMFYLEPVFFLKTKMDRQIGVTTCGGDCEGWIVFLKIWTILENCHRTRIGDWIMRHAPRYGCALAVRSAGRSGAEYIVEFPMVMRARRQRREGRDHPIEDFKRFDPEEKRDLRFFRVSR